MSQAEKMYKHLHGEMSHFTRSDDLQSARAAPIRADSHR